MARPVLVGYKWYPGTSRFLDTVENKMLGRRIWRPVAKGPDGVKSGGRRSLASIDHCPSSKRIPVGVAGESSTGVLKL